MKRFIAILLSLIMILPVVAFAAEPETPQQTPPTHTAEEPAQVPATNEFWVRVRSSNFADVLNTIATTVLGAPMWDSLDGKPSNLSTAGDYTMVFNGDTTVVMHVVAPTYSLGTLQPIRADDAANSSKKELQNYIERTLVVSQTNEKYRTAMGNAVDTGAVYCGDFKWNAYGGTYEIPISVDNVVIGNVTMTVTSVQYSTPSVSIGVNGKVSCTPTSLEYSIDRVEWKPIRDGSSIGSNAYGKTVYFRVPASGSSLASDYVSEYCKEPRPADNPPKMELKYNSYSVYIDNTDDYAGYEFAIVKGTADESSISYRSKTSWTNLEQNTRYTVYARLPGTSYYWPSSPVSVSVTTAKGTETAIDYSKVSTANTIYMQAVGTVAFNIENNVFSVYYTDKDVSLLKNDIKNNSRKSTVVTTLDVSMPQEETDTRSFNKLKFTMPGDMGLLQLRLHTPWFTVVRDTSTTSIELYEGVRSGATSALRSWASGRTHVYGVKSNTKGATTIRFPWEWPDRADLDGLKVYYTADGKSTKELRYSLVEGGLQFTLPADGYFSIKNLYRDYGELPFVDVQSSWAYSYVHHCYEHGIFSGTSATTFEPDGEITRAQLVTVIARMRGIDDTKVYSDVLFTDVPDNAWYYPHLTYCIAAGAIKNVEEEFLPDEPVTRAEIFAMLNYMFPYNGVLWEPFNCSDRETAPTYALNAMDALYTNGIIVGNNGASMHDKPLTRAELATILYRMRTADYWQGTTYYTVYNKLDSSKVKDTPNIWISDNAGVFSKRTSITDALQYFYNTTGVRPYLYTARKTADVDAYEIYDDKFRDNGHVVIAYQKDVGFDIYVGTDAARAIGNDGVKELKRLIMEYWDDADMSYDDAIIDALHEAADTIVKTETVVVPSSFKQPTPIGDWK